MIPRNVSIIQMRIGHFLKSHLVEEGRIVHGHILLVVRGVTFRLSDVLLLRRVCEFVQRHPPIVFDVHVLVLISLFGGFDLSIVIKRGVLVAVSSHGFVILLVQVGFELPVQLLFALWHDRLRLVQGGERRNGDTRRNFLLFNGGGS